MLPETTLVLPLLLLCAVSFCVCADVRANPGEDVALQCQGPTDFITRRTWTRTDLKKEVYVFFFRENRTYEHFQHPSFRGRVELRDPEMKNGDVSVILKNVTVNDTGTYQCKIRTSKGDALERNITVIIESGDPDEGRRKDGGNLNKHFGLFAVLILSVIVVVVVGFVLWTRQRSLKKNSEQPAADEADQTQKSSISITTV